MLNNSQEIILQKAKDLISTVQHLIDEENITEATLNLVRLEQVINSIDLPKSARGGILHRVAILRAKANQWDDAWRIANSIDHYAFGPKTQRKLREMQEN
ncbi:MAG TPA: hypothetical protein VH186_21680 [Chloroflexia bacterium]|nr:hypothetical protein [Chloroflexia bacterium]